MAAVYRWHIPPHGAPNGGHQRPAFAGALMFLLACQLLVGVGLASKLLEEVHDIV